MSDRLVLDYSNMLQIDRNLLEEMEALRTEVQAAAAEVHENMRSNRQGFFNLPYQEGVKKEVKTHAEYIRTGFQNFVVIGIGGSALGNRFLHTALNHPYYNLLCDNKRKGNPRIFILDSIDSDHVTGLLDVLDLRKTAFNVITKSGGTSETMANFMVIKDRLEKEVGHDRVRHHITATTDCEKGSLLDISRREGYKVLYIPRNVGGRYSVLSAVGLLSAAVSGIDIDRLLEGAACMAERCSGDIDDNPALLGALLQYIAYRKGKNISVVMAYSEFLNGFGDWYCQLWAESLGKRTDIGGTIKQHGQTPLKAIGPRDQHSLLQLFLDGPDDKIFNLIKVRNRDSDFIIPDIYKQYRGISYLAGSTVSTLLNAEFSATEQVLARRNRMNYRIVLPAVDEYSIGQLIFMYMYMTAYMGALLKINAFDQPAVEEGKVITRELMTR